MYCVPQRLVEHAGARGRRAETHEALLTIARFFDNEAVALARVLATTGYSRYPVPQQDRDLLFTETNY